MSESIVLHSSQLCDFRWCLFDGQHWPVDVFPEDEGMAVAGESFPFPDDGDEGESPSWVFVRFLGDPEFQGSWVPDTTLSQFTWVNAVDRAPPGPTPQAKAVAAWAKLAKDRDVTMSPAESKARLAWAQEHSKCKQAAKEAKNEKKKVKPELSAGDASPLATNPRTSKVKAEERTAAKPAKITAAQRTLLLSSLHVPAKGEEKRLARAKQMSIAVSDRLSRALAERMFLVKREDHGTVETTPSASFTVVGSTGNIYTVQVDHRPSCTCPDFKSRQNVCKHIMFVLCRVLGVPRGSALIPQNALLTKELQLIFSLAPKRVSTAVDAANSVKQALGVVTHTEATTRKPSKKEAVPATVKPEGDCAICCESLQGGGGSVTSCQQCKNFIHTQCFNQYKSYNKGGLCPLCRQPFEASGGGSGRKTQRSTSMLTEGHSSSSLVRRTSSMGSNYQNVSGLQPGVSLTRDTSTYRTNEWLERNGYGFHDDEDDDDAPARQRRRVR